MREAVEVWQMTVTPTHTQLLPTSLQGNNLTRSQRDEQGDFPITLEFLTLSWNITLCVPGFPKDTV